jgi:hypothetical protein
MMLRSSILGLGMLLVACFGHDAAVEGGRYGANLEACNRHATTLCESIACENYYRGRSGRMLRDVPVHCNADGGTPVPEGGSDADAQ